tara:strand:+ start:184 stop:516 length:333 start_codon:yes stop_codon:yes gene_type:complete
MVSTATGIMLVEASDGGDGDGGLSRTRVHVFERNDLTSYVHEIYSPATLVFSSGGTSRDWRVLQLPANNKTASTKGSSKCKFVAVLRPDLSESRTASSALVEQLVVSFIV